MDRPCKALPVEIVNSSTVLGFYALTLIDIRLTFNYIVVSLSFGAAYVFVLIILHKFVLVVHRFVE